MRNTPDRGQRGEGNLGYLVVILILAVLGYGAFRIVPVYLEQDEFFDELLVIAGKGTVQTWDDRTIRRQVMALAQSMDFQVEQNDIRVERVRQRPEIIVVVDYSRTLEFPGDYQYVLELHSAAAGNLGW